LCRCRKYAILNSLGRWERVKRIWKRLMKLYHFAGSLKLVFLIWLHCLYSYKKRLYFKAFFFFFYHLISYSFHLILTCVISTDTIKIFNCKKYEKYVQIWWKMNNFCYMRKFKTKTKAATSLKRTSLNHQLIRLMMIKKWFMDIN
jgi:hypothetical protein